MDAELKAKWIAALRSGEFKRARSSMYDGKGYCCLGVLCKVAGRTVNTDRKSGDRNNIDNYHFCDTILGGEMREVCVAKNDDDGLSFPEIADWLESQP